MKVYANVIQLQIGQSRYRRGRLSSFLPGFR